MFVGGQADLDDAGNVNHANQLRAQADAAMNDVERVLDTLGGRFEDLVKLNAFYLGVTLADEVELLRQIRRRIGGDVPPVISLVSLPRLPYHGMTVTIEAVAIDNSHGGAPRRAATPYRQWEWPKDAEFSQGLRCGEMLFVSVQMARDTTQKIQHTDDIISQARLTIDNIARVLAAVDADLDDVVKVNAWYRGHGTDADWRRAAQIRSDAFRFRGPAATGVPVPLTYPDGGLIRQECWAIRGTDSASPFFELVRRALGLANARTVSTGRQGRQADLPRRLACARRGRQSTASAGHEDADPRHHGLHRRNLGGLRHYHG